MVHLHSMPNQEERMLCDKQSVAKFTYFNKDEPQLFKIKEKIRMCLTLFLEIKDKRQVITDYKLALYFVYFLESLALQDEAINNADLKSYIIEIIGKLNVERIRNIRCWLFHREQYYFISPQHIHRATFQENLSTVFEGLQKFLEFVYQKLCDKDVDKPEWQPGFLVYQKESLGIKIDEDDVSHIIESLSHDFIKEAFSLKKSQNPEKTLFDFIINFIPLLRLSYRKVIKPGHSLTELTDLRNLLVHNSYILCQNSKEDPYLVYQNKLRESKEIVLKINFCSKISREFNIILETDEIQHTEDKLQRILSNFNELFMKELNPKTVLVSDGFKNKGENPDHLRNQINTYFQSLFIGDAVNKNNIDNMNIEVTDLPEVYYRFSIEKRKSVLELFTALKEVRESATLSKNTCQRIEENIRTELESYGISDSEFGYICEYVLNEKQYGKIELCNQISKHIKRIIKLSKRPNLDMVTAIQYYNEYLDNKRSPYFKRYANIIPRWKFKDKVIKFEISNSIYKRTLSKMLKNYISFFFDTFPSNSTVYKNLETVFQDSLITELISSKISNLNKLKLQILEWPFLMPLGVDLLCNNKLKFDSSAEERNFVHFLTKRLLTFESGNDILNDLFSSKSKVRTFPSECLDLVLEMNLIQEKPDKVHFLFLIPAIQYKIIHLFRSESAPRYKSILSEFLKYKYRLSSEAHKDGRFEETLGLIDAKPAGLLCVLKEVEKNSIFGDEITNLEMKYFIAKVKYQMGIKRQLKDPEKKHSNLTDSLKILEAISSKISISNFKEDIRVGFELGSKVYKARIFHFQGKCDESCNEYRDIFAKLYSLNSIHKDEYKIEQLFDAIGLMNHFYWESISNIIKSLVYCEEYKYAIKLNQNYLEMFNVMLSYGREQNCRIDFLKTEEEKLSLCIKVLNYINFVLFIGNELMGPRNKLFTKSKQYFCKIRKNRKCIWNKSMIK